MIVSCLYRDSVEKGKGDEAGVLLAAHEEAIRKAGALFAFLGLSFALPKTFIRTLTAYQPHLDRAVNLYR